MYLVWDERYIGQVVLKDRWSFMFLYHISYYISCEAAIKSENRIYSVMACCFIIITNNSAQLCMVKADLAHQHHQ